MPEKVTQIQRARRARFSGGLPKPRSGDTPYSPKRPELRDLTKAEQVLLVVNSDAWQKRMVPICRAIDRKRGGTNPIKYTSEELELFLLFGRAHGTDNYIEIIRILDRFNDADRRALGFDKPRHSEKRKLVNRNGLPGRSTVWHHTQRFPVWLRAMIWQQIEIDLGVEHLLTPEMQEEARIIYMDSSDMPTHYRCPIRSKKLGDPEREGKITCPDGGYRDGQDGFKLTSAPTSTGVPLPGCWLKPPINPNDKQLGPRVLLERYDRDVRPHMPKGKLVVMVLDGGFHSQVLRKELHKRGIVEVMHVTSHDKRSRSEARKRTEEKHELVNPSCPAYKNWFANGHRELFCACGQGTVAKRFSFKQDGEVVPRVEGSCPNCGSVTVTSGDWRLDGDGRFVRCHPDDPVEKRDYQLGNGLTFNDPVAKAHGEDRFGHDEGFHGTLCTRFKIIEGKQWLRSSDQGDLNVAMSFAILHAVALEYRRRRREAGSAPPDALAQAA